MRYFESCRLIFLTLFFVIACSVNLRTLGSTQFWPSAGAVWDVNGPWMLQYKETYYFYKDDSDSDHAKSDVTGVYKGSRDIFDLGLGFAYLDGSENTKQERRPYISGTVRGKLLERDVSNRFMVEYRDLSDTSDYWRFRNKVTVNAQFEALDTRSIRLLDTELYKPYVADEVFFNSNGEGLSQNRVYVGVQVKIVKNLGTDLYYLYQSNKSSSGEWGNNHIIGTDFIFKF